MPEIASCTQPQRSAYFLFLVMRREIKARCGTLVCVQVVGPGVASHGLPSWWQGVRMTVLQGRTA